MTITASLMLAVYGIVNGQQDGWTSALTLGRLAGAVALFAVFLVVESRVAAPLVRLSLFRRRNLATANAVAVLWAAAMFAWFFLSALYLQAVLGYTPLEVGLAFLPANVVMGTLSIAVSARLVMRFGIRRPLVVGLSLGAAGLALFARAPEGGSFLVDILPSMVLLGIGAGIAFNPMLLAAMSDVSEEESGLASGVVNTAFMMGGAARAGRARQRRLGADGDPALGGRERGHRTARRLPPGVLRRGVVRRGRGGRRRPAPAHASARDVAR